MIGSYCRPTSVVSWLTDTVLKIRLFGLATPWSGDIPLEAVMGKRKSFMVKLPLRDKLGSTTIWCTILTEELAGQVNIQIIYRECHPVKIFPGSETRHLQPHVHDHVPGTGRRYRRGGQH